MTTPTARPHDEERPPVRWVHLGLGAFFRAFCGPFLQDVGGWGVTGVSLRSPGVRDRMAARGNVYTATELRAEGMAPRDITIVRTVLVAPEDPQAVIDAMADPAVTIVSLTVTEKGYCLDPATRRLRLDHPDIVHDCAHALPRSAPGFIVRALAARHARGLPPFTVVSCDNLRDNGEVIRAAVGHLAREIDPALATWISTQCRFPSTMIDRIVPATTPQDIETVAALTGVHDEAVVMHEPFRQWVVTDDFAGDRPALETVGVEMVDDVAPFEHMKLRMLNGAHSALAYLGYLAGYQTVFEAGNTPLFAHYLRHLWRVEIAPTLRAPPGTDLAVYADQLLERFQNPAIRHSTYQIAMDGSQKLPQRLLDTISDRLAADLPVDGLLLAVAAWIRYSKGVDMQGNRFTVQDPMADTLQAAHDDDDAARTVANMLALDAIFDPALAARLKTPLTQVYTDLDHHGIEACMKRVLS